MQSPGGRWTGLRGELTFEKKKKQNKDLSLCFLLSRFLFVSTLVSTSVSGGLAVCGIHHLPASVSYQAWTDLSMTRPPMPLPIASLNCTLIKLALLIMRA